jgi:hypothetical protein
MMRFLYDRWCLSSHDSQITPAGPRSRAGGCAGWRVRQAFMNRPRGRIESRVNYRCMWSADASGKTVPLTSLETAIVGQMGDVKGVYRTHRAS